ncbi:hypothetical protein, partial [Vibrio parahaemolyticus]|uniref:hypothetical protein n=1 Tax=Vibrio parahaemolyticus TaxID=670 RepID=UPI001E5955A8
NLTMRTFNKATETTWNLPHQRKRLAASKSAFVPTNSQSRVSAKKFDSVTQKVTAPKNKSTAETMPIVVFYHAD